MELSKSGSHQALARVTGEIIAWRKVTWNSKTQKADIGPPKERTNSKEVWIAEAKTYRILLLNGKFIMGGSIDGEDKDRFDTAVRIMANPEQRVRFLELLKQTSH
jgi:hypothetical protein